MITELKSDRARHALSDLGLGWIFNVSPTDVDWDSVYELVEYFYEDVVVEKIERIR